MFNNCPLSTQSGRIKFNPLILFFVFAGHSPVYRLDITSFKIEKVDSVGEYPGWIYNHSAALEGKSTIRIRGGEILSKSEEEETHQVNKHDFELDLNTLKWTKHDHVPLSGMAPSFPEEYKTFEHGDETVLTVEEENEWRLLKVISVYRIDVSENKKIRFEHETVTATSDDFMFVVAYSTSKPFGSSSEVEKAVADKKWALENDCRVCRTTAFPKHSQYACLLYTSPSPRD